MVYHDFQRYANFAFFFVSLFQDEYGTIEYLRACLHGDGGPQIGDVTCQQALKQFVLNETRCFKKNEN